MNKAGLLKNLSNMTNLPAKDSRRIVDALLQIITETLKKDEPVFIRGFGSFKVVHYKMYMGMNPNTREQIRIMPKKFPRFVATRGWKAMIQGNDPDKTK